MTFNLMGHLRTVGLYGHWEVAVELETFARGHRGSADGLGQ